jgi:hypothetical protein
MASISLCNWYHPSVYWPIYLNSKIPYQMLCLQHCNLSNRNSNRDSIKAQDFTDQNNIVLRLRYELIYKEDMIILRLAADHVGVAAFCCDIVLLEQYIILVSHCPDPIERRLISISMKFSGSYKLVIKKLARNFYM